MKPVSSLSWPGVARRLDSLLKSQTPNTHAPQPSKAAAILVLLALPWSLAAADIELTAISGKGMESPIPNPNSPDENSHFLLQNSGGAIPQEDGTVLTGGVLDEPVFNPRTVNMLWQPGTGGSPGTLQTIVIQDEPTPASVPDSIIKSATTYHYSPSSGFLVYSFAAETNSLNQRAVIWNKPDLGSSLSPLFKTGDAAPGIPGATFRFPSPSLLTANRDGNYAFTASLDGPPASQSFGGWMVLDGVATLVHQNDNPAFEAGVLGFGAPIVGGTAVLFTGIFPVGGSSYPALVKWEDENQRLITHQFGTLVLGTDEEIYTRQFGGKSIDDSGRVLFHHQTNLVQESLIREEMDGTFHRLVSKDDVLDGDATITSFMDHGSNQTRPLLAPDGRAVFLARFRRPGDVADQLGIWRETASGSGQFNLVVDGSQADELIDFDRYQNIPQGAFDIDNPFISPDGLVVFMASFGNSNTLNTNDTETAGFKAIFAEDAAGDIHLVARTGQAIVHTNDVKIINNLFLTNTSRDSLGRVGFNASLLTADPYGLFGTVSYIAQLPGAANAAPVLGFIEDRTIDEETTLTFTAQATDPDLPSQTLSYSLGPGAPEGAEIDSITGEFSWTPAENQGPMSFPITVIVADDFVPPATDSEEFIVTVNEVNLAPNVLPVVPKTVIEENLLTFAVAATDPDLPVQMLTYSLGAGAPAGAAIHPDTGQFSWTPTAAQGPGIYLFTIIVEDDWVPKASATIEVVIVVNEPNGILADFGDAPDPGYPTVAASDGARHLLGIPDFHLGASIDFEGDGLPDLDGLGDDNNNGLEPVPDSEADDEDGVTFLTSLSPGSTATFDVFATIPESFTEGGKLDAWIDFNQDSDWSDIGEQVFVNANLEAGSNLLELTIPGNAVLGVTHARFRFSLAGNLNPTGLASDGEVEDYQIAIVPPGLKFESIGFENDNIIIRWSGGATLESAPAVSGPWNEVEAASSPYTIIQGGDPSRFYRLLEN